MHKPSFADCSRTERVVWTTLGLMILYSGHMIGDWYNKLIGGRRHAGENIGRGHATLSGADCSRAERVVGTTLGLTIE
jgi:hypothetical protein